MSRTTISIPRRPAGSRAVVLALLLAVLLAVIATVIWQGARTAGTDGAGIGQRAGTVESAPVVPLRQLERAEQVQTARLGRVGRGFPAAWRLPRPDATPAARAVFLSELRRDRSRATGPTPALDRQIMQLEELEALVGSMQADPGDVLGSDLRH
jgi:hypothetical protein